MDCGPSCLKMIAAFYGKKIPIQYLRDLCGISYQGVSFSGLEEGANKLGFKTLKAELPFSSMTAKAPLPCIVHWNMQHFVVVWKITEKHVYVADPSQKKAIKYNHTDFIKNWVIDQERKTGRAIFLEETHDFQELKVDTEPRVSLLSLAVHLKSFRKTIFYIIGSLLLASLLSLAIPFLTQAIVDKGIRGNNPGLLAIICLGQLMIFSGRMFMDFIRSRLLFKIGMDVSINILSSFLAKIMKLRIAFFDKRHVGDNIQRISDNQRVEDFLTVHLVSVLMSVITVLVFGGVLLYYDWKIFLLFLTGSVAGILWNYRFEEKRGLLDQRKFKLFSANQRLLMETFSAMQEIKLTGSEDEKNSQWKGLTKDTYLVKLESLKMDQHIRGVSLLINESKNILTTYVTAMLVINGSLTLGAMLAITYITGYLSGAITQLADFIKASQDTYFSLQRIAEVQHEPDEDTDQHILLDERAFAKADIRLNQVNFRYGPSSPDVLRDISLTIPSGKITAIVGMSGSGKTTLLKLLLKFYPVSRGEIAIDGVPLNTMNVKAWRHHCGVVMQDGYIFSDTIANNIWVGAENKNQDALIQASMLANLHEFVSSLPFGYNTLIGREGTGLSEGQMQRLLIARLIYRKPSFLFLDEATNSLDATNEKMIIENLNKFFGGRTVVVVAHRLSTVKNAHNIVVLENGVLMEQGTHEELTRTKGVYFHLVKNQLEMGK